MRPFPNKSYQCIVADPPWSYENKNTGGSMKSGSVSKYPVLTLDEIKELPVRDIANRDAILFLWVTVPLKHEIAKSGLVEAWGFKYKTSLYWNKLSYGMGFWYRGQVEECWVCVKGNIKAFRSSKPNIFQSKPRKHSQKPEEFFGLIEPELDKYELTDRIELFARERRPGWDCWGNEVGAEPAMQE